MRGAKVLDYFEHLKKMKFISFEILSKKKYKIITDYWSVGVGSTLLSLIEEPDNVFFPGFL